MSALTVSVPVAAIRLASCASLPASGIGPATAQLVGELLVQAEGPVLSQLIALLTAQLREQAPQLSKAQRAAAIQLIATLEERLEEFELAANPARQASRAARTAPAMQNRIGFLPHLLPK